MKILSTDGFQGSSVAFSPFSGQKFACSASKNFGLIGSGCVFVFNFESNNEIKLSLPLNEAVYDCVWGECQDDLLLAACGDGSLNLFDLSQKSSFKLINTFTEHEKEVHCVAWDLIHKEDFLSASWDHSVKLWKNNGQHSLRTFHHDDICWSVCWSPYHHGVFASSCADGSLKVWDLNATQPSHEIKAHEDEVLSCDWNKYNENIFVTASADKTIKQWDIRNLSAPQSIMNGHTQAVRKVKCSPHQENVLASSSYDMACFLWDSSSCSVTRKLKAHTEFALGIDFNLFEKRQFISCGWDDKICLYDDI